MESAVPVIFGGNPPRLRVSALGRLLALAVAVGCLGPLLAASAVHPSPAGVGTHTDLGFYQCQFLDRTGVPCPSCGMTTSFAWFVRGHLLGSLYVQPMGLVLACLAVTAFWGGLYIAVTGRPIHRLLSAASGHYYLIALFSVGLLAWAWKIVIHLRGLDGWG